ncbi:putative U2 small nuclear ribonucleoprotein B'' [Cocos nucifera]|nr:putative U2 small nuclear ribonucleoprotein B'' [Cocos nucifera]
MIHPAAQPYPARPYHDTKPSLPPPQPNPFSPSPAAAAMHPPPATVVIETPAFPQPYYLHPPAPPVAVPVIHPNPEQQKINTLFVSGLPDDVKPREIHNLFRRRQGFDSCQLKYTGRGDQVVAFATFFNHQSAMAAMTALNGVVFDPETGATLHIELARSNSRKRPRGGGAYGVIDKRVKVTDDDQDLWSNDGEGGSDEPLGTENDNSSNKGALAAAQSGGVVDKLDSDQAASSSVNLKVNNERIRPLVEGYWEPEKPTSGDIPPCSTLFIANLGPTCTEEELKQVLSEYPGFHTIKMRGRGGMPVAFADFAVLKFLMERNGIIALHGQVTVGTLILQDCAVGLLFALLPVLGGTSGVLQGVTSMAKLLIVLLAFLAVLSMLSRTFVPWFFKLMNGLSNQTQTGELYQLASVAFCLLVAWSTKLQALALSGNVDTPHHFTSKPIISVCSDKLGLSLELGSFAAGVMISTTDLSHHTLEHIEPIRNFFAALFLASIGMLIHVHFLWNHVDILLAAVILVISVKTTVATVVVKGFGYSNKTSVLVGMSLAQIGEFAFVLLSRASNLHLVEVTTPLLFKLIPAVIRLGVLLGWFSPDSSQMEIEPIRNFFAALFLASIGMLIHVHFLWNHVDILLAAVILVISVKTTVATVVVKGFGYSNKTSVLVGMSLAQIGEFAFVLLSRASNLHLVEVTTPLLFKLIPAVIRLGVLLGWFSPDSSQMEILQHLVELSSTTVLLGILEWFSSH